MVGSRSIKRERKRDLKKRFQVQLQERGIREVLNSNARENVCARFQVWLENRDIFEREYVSFAKRKNVWKVLNLTKKKEKNF